MTSRPLQSATRGKTTFMIYRHQKTLMLVWMFFIADLFVNEPQRLNSILVMSCERLTLMQSDISDTCPSSIIAWSDSTLHGLRINPPSPTSRKSEWLCWICKWLPLKLSFFNLSLVSWLSASNYGSMSHFYTQTSGCVRQFFPLQNAF